MRRHVTVQDRESLDERPGDIWLYFLRHAEKIVAETPPTALQVPFVQRAVEELRLPTQTDIERE
jgi:hypothetical protein